SSVARPDPRSPGRPRPGPRRPPVRTRSASPSRRRGGRDPRRAATRPMRESRRPPPPRPRRRYRTPASSFSVLRSGTLCPSVYPDAPPCAPDDARRGGANDAARCRTSARRGAAREVLMAPSRRPRGSRGRIGVDGRGEGGRTVLVVRGGAAARAGDPDQGGERGGRVADDRDARGHGGAGLLARAYAGRTRAGRDPGGSERGTDARGAPAGRPDDPGGRADAPRAG